MLIIILKLAHFYQKFSLLSNSEDSLIFNALKTEALKLR